MKNKTVFVACDTSNLSKIKKILTQTKTKKLKIVPKFGLQFFYSKQGRKFLENVKSDFWLDLKIYYRACQWWIRNAKSSKKKSNKNK